MPKDIIEELLNEEEEEVIDDDDKLAAIEAKFEASEKEKHGLLQSVKDERRKRQDMRDRLNNLTDTVQTLLEARKTQTPEEVLSEATGKGIPVTYDDDGEGFVDPSALSPILKPYEDKIAQLEQALQLTNANVEVQQESNELIDGILAEDERYNGAHSKYKGARKWVNDRVVEYQKDNGITDFLKSGEALDHVFTPELEKEFQDEFEGFDLDTIVCAEDSVRQFRKMLNSVAAATTPKETTTTKTKANETFTKVLNKPSGLGKSTNAKTGPSDPVEVVEGFTAEDILNLSDDAADALMKAMLQEERSDGVKF